MSKKTPKTPRQTTTIAARVPLEVAAELEKMAVRPYTVGFYVAQAVEEWLARHKRKQRKAEKAVA